MARMLKNFRAVAKNRLQSPLTVSRSFSVETSEWYSWPRQREGNIYSVNWSLVEDGVVPVGDAFHNARINLLTNRLGVKANVQSIDKSKPLYFGKYSVLEAGDSISHEDFQAMFTAQCHYLSSGIDLFVEDGALGSFYNTRLGVRIVSDDPSVALIGRSLLVATPPREVDHRARFDGWNFDPRWKDANIEWNGDHYETQTSVAKPGQRPICAFIGGPGDAVAVQFVEKSGSIVGANISAGGATPIRGVVEAINLATTVVMNEMYESSLALPSVSITKGDKTAIIVGADDSVIDSIISTPGLLYGAYGNVITPSGVSALWNGVIGAAPSGSLLGAITGSDASPINSDIPVITSEGKTTIPIIPHNLAFPAAHIAFYDNNATSKTISEGDVIKKLVEITDPNKEALIASLVKGVKVSVISKPAGVASLL